VNKYIKLFKCNLSVKNYKKETDSQMKNLTSLKKVIIFSVLSLGHFLR